VEYPLSKQAISHILAAHYPSTDRKVVPPPTAKSGQYLGWSGKNGQEVHATNGDDKKNDSMMRLYALRTAFITEDYQKQP
jgi:hypothetical protein